MPIHGFRCPNTLLTGQQNLGSNQFNHTSASHLQYVLSSFASHEECNLNPSSDSFLHPACAAYLGDCSKKAGFGKMGTKFQNLTCQQLSLFYNEKSLALLPQSPQSGVDKKMVPQAGRKRERESQRNNEVISH